MRCMTLVARSVARISLEQGVRFSDCMAEIRQFGSQMQGWDLHYLQDYEDLTHEYHVQKDSVARERDELVQLRTALSTATAKARAAAADASRAPAAAVVGTLEETFARFFDTVAERLKGVVEQAMEEASKGGKLQATMAPESVNHLEKAFEDSVYTVWVDLKTSDEKNKQTFKALLKALAKLAAKLKGPTGPIRVEIPPAARAEATPRISRTLLEAESPEIPISAAQEVMERFAATSEDEVNEEGEAGAGVADMDLSGPVSTNWRATLAAKELQREKEESAERKAAEAHRGRKDAKELAAAFKKRQKEEEHAKEAERAERAAEEKRKKAEEEKRVWEEQAKEAEQAERAAEEEKRVREEQAKEAKRAERAAEEKRKAEEEKRVREEQAKEAERAERVAEEKHKAKEEKRVREEQAKEAERAERAAEEKCKAEEEKRVREEQGKEAERAERTAEEKRKKAEEDKRLREEQTKALKVAEEKRAEALKTTMELQAERERMQAQMEKLAKLEEVAKEEMERQ
ncbi:unnamed protein product [Closterium sp. NIES-54]